MTKAECVGFISLNPYLFLLHRADKSVISTYPMMPQVSISHRETID